MQQVALRSVHCKACILAKSGSKNYKRFAGLKHCLLNTHLAHLGLIDGCCTLYGYHILYCARRCAGRGCHGQCDIVVSGLSEYHNWVTRCGIAHMLWLWRETPLPTCIFILAHNTVTVELHALLWVGCEVAATEVHGHWLCHGDEILMIQRCLPQALVGCHAQHTTLVVRYYL